MQQRELTLHPLVLFGAFFGVLGFAMFLMHPLCLLLSLCGAAWCLVCLGGKETLFQAGRFALPAALFAAVLNVLFNHRGATILFYLPGGNPCTLESLCYGAAAGLLLSGVLLWFSCCTRVLTTDHFTYLFSRVSPATALLFSMTLRFLPQFRRRFQQVWQAQTTPAGLPAKLKAAFACFGAVLAWALEHAGDTADSMNARGYGLRGKTSFSIYRKTSRDRMLLFGLLTLICSALCACALGLFRFSYAPCLLVDATTPQHVCAFFVYALLCAYPAMILKLEDRPWRCSKSTI